MESLKLKVVKDYGKAIRIETLKGFYMNLPKCEAVKINGIWAIVDKEFFLEKKKKQEEWIKSGKIGKEDSPMPTRNKEQSGDENKSVTPKVTDPSSQRLSIVRENHSTSDNKPLEEKEEKTKKNRKEKTEKSKYVPDAKKTSLIIEKRKEYQRQVEPNPKTSKMIKEVLESIKKNNEARREEQRYNKEPAEKLRKELEKFK